MRTLWTVNWLLAAACHLTACANTGTDAGQAPLEPVQGGPAPATLLSSDQLKALKSILQRYRADRLDAEQAKALLEALRNAGLVDGPALHRAMADLGFSAKQLAVLAGTAHDNRTGPDTQGIVTPSGGVVPPRP